MPAVTGALFVCISLFVRLSCPTRTSTQGRMGQTSINNRHVSHPGSTAPYAVFPPQRRVASGEQPKIPEASPSDCFGNECGAPRQGNESRECRGIECKLPLRMRPRAPAHRAGGCEGDSCPHPVHVSDRAAQFVGDFPELNYPGSEQPGATLGVQLTCDIKPGENEVPSEDALILQLQLAKGQEKLVETLRAQQVLMVDLQQRVSEQQATLLSQQREILEQQRNMQEQLEAVKAQYGLLAEALQQSSFHSLQSYLESHLQGLQDQVRGHLHKSYAVHKVDVDAKLMDVAEPLLRVCGSCGPEEYCDFQREVPQCESCTTCPPGFFLVSQCSLNADRICQDRDECLEIPNLCGERVKCLNTPGGFRCLGVSQQDGSAGLCGHEYFYNRELEECQACSDCEGEMATVPCSATRDAICGPSLPEPQPPLSRAWSSSIILPVTGDLHTGLQLEMRSEGSAGDLLSPRQGQVLFQQHGLVWADLNFAVKHGCRSFLQVSLQVNGSEGGVKMSTVRLEQPDGKRLLAAGVSVLAEVEPGQVLSALIGSPGRHCNRSEEVQGYELATPLSLLWLSHDTGAVAMMAQAAPAMHYQGSYRPALKMASVSDPYVLALSHDGRGVRFIENGVVRFAFQQAFYAAGQACVQEGLVLAAYLSHNGSGAELMQAFKAGVNYRDASVSLSGMTTVDVGDMLSFEIRSPAQCSVRYMGDGSALSTLSLLWIPSTAAVSLRAALAPAGLPQGPVRNRPLCFRLVSTGTPQIQLQEGGGGFVFGHRGVASISLTLKLIYSCRILKLSLLGPGSAAPLAQQVGGPMPEGSDWTSVGVRASFEVNNGTVVSVAVDCVRGRINQIARDAASYISVMLVVS